MSNGINSTLLWGLMFLLLNPRSGLARQDPKIQSPAFTTVPELRAAFALLYNQKFVQARHSFKSWESRNLEELFGEVAIAATYLFEELFRYQLVPCPD